MFLLTLKTINYTEICLKISVNLKTQEYTHIIKLILNCIRHSTTLI